MECPTTLDAKIARDIKRGGHDLNIIHFLKGKVHNGVFVDIGAHIGTYCVPLSYHAKHTIAFEPVPENLAWLKKNCQGKNVNIIPSILSDGHRSMKMVKPTNNSGQSYAKETFYDPKDSFVSTVLDDWDLAPTVIKIDVEGHEAHVLRGSRETIRKYKPGILFEFDYCQLKRAGSSVSDLARELRGYKLHLFSQKFGYIRLPSLHLLRKKGTYNLYAS